MAMKYSTVKCTKSSNANSFVVGKSYRLCHATHDDVVETTGGQAFGITAQLNHESTDGCFSFQLIGTYNGKITNREG